MGLLWICKSTLYYLPEIGVERRILILRGMLALRNFQLFPGMCRLFEASSDCEGIVTVVVVVTTIFRITQPF